MQVSSRVVDEREALFVGWSEGQAWCRIWCAAHGSPVMQGVRTQAEAREIGLAHLRELHPGSLQDVEVERLWAFRV